MWFQMFLSLPLRESYRCFRCRQHKFEKTVQKPFPALHISTETRGKIISLKQFNIKLDVACKVKYIWLARTKVVEAAKCPLTVILWVIADVCGADGFPFCLELRKSVNSYMKE